MANSFSFQNQSALPNGVHCVLSGYVHAAWTQTATVQDTNGNTVAEISGSGGTDGSYAPMSATPGNTNTFQPQESGQPYSVVFTKNSGDSDVQFIYGDEAINCGTTTYAETYTFLTEDGTDNDFNDSTVFFTWNLTAS